MMHGVIVLENLCFRASTRKRKSDAFEKSVFVTIFTRDLWTVGQTEEKSLRFQSKRYTCGQGLIFLFVILKKKKTL